MMTRNNVTPSKALYAAQVMHAYVYVNEYVYIYVYVYIYLYIFPMYWFIQDHN